MDHQVLTLLSKTPIKFTTKAVQMSGVITGTASLSKNYPDIYEAYVKYIKYPSSYENVKTTQIEQELDEGIQYLLTFEVDADENESFIGALYNREEVIAAMLVNSLTVSFRNGDKTCSYTHQGYIKRFEDISVELKDSFKKKLSGNFLTENFSPALNLCIPVMFLDSAISSLWGCADLKVGVETSKLSPTSKVTVYNLHLSAEFNDELAKERIKNTLLTALELKSVIEPEVVVYFGNQFSVVQKITMEDVFLLLSKEKWDFNVKFVFTPTEISIR